MTNRKESFDVLNMLSNSSMQLDSIKPIRTKRILRAVFFVVFYVATCISLADKGFARPMAQAWCSTGIVYAIVLLSLLVAKWFVNILNERSNSNGMLFGCISSLFALILRLLLVFFVCAMAVGIVVITLEHTTDFSHWITIDRNKENLIFWGGIVVSTVSFGYYIYSAVKIILVCENLKENIAIYEKQFNSSEYLSDEICL